MESKCKVVEIRCKTAENDENGWNQVKSGDNKMETREKW